MIAEMAAPPTPTRSEMRAPSTRRARMSRPRPSVPSTKSPARASTYPGAFSRRATSWASGSCGSISGARIAATTNSRTSSSPIAAEPSSRRMVRSPRDQRARDAPPRTARGWAAVMTDTASGQPYPRIEPGVCKVRKEIDDDDQGSSHEHEYLNNGHIAGADRIDGQAAHAGVREHRFGDDRVAEQERDLHAQERDDRDRGVLQRV